MTHKWFAQIFLSLQIYFIHVNSDVKTLNFGASLSPAEPLTKQNNEEIGSCLQHLSGLALCLITFNFTLKKSTDFSLLLPTVLLFRAKDMLIFTSLGIPAARC